MTDTPCDKRIAAPLSEVIQTTCKKRKLETQSDVYLAQLMCISGVSEMKARVIRNVYQNFEELFAAYKKTDDKEGLLKDFQAGKKKIGIVLSGRIYNSIGSISKRDQELPKIQGKNTKNKKL